MKSVTAVSSLAVLLLSFQAYADSSEQWAQSPFFAVPPQTIVAERVALVDRDAAAALVRSATGGRVLAVRSASADGRAVYHVKVLLQGGRVRIMRVDAETGQLLD
ncbi:MAG: hypothetical protein WA970_05475 [Gammaproteobacteria bacterium]